MIGKFQNLFKSNSSKKNSSEDVNQNSHGKQAVELVNFHKIDSNPRLIQTVKTAPDQNLTKPPNDVSYFNFTKEQIDLNTCFISTNVNSQIFILIF